MANGWGSPFVARGIAFDRFAAAVCDGGIWDLHERAFLVGRTPFEAEFLRRGISRAARDIKCPVLISTRERGWLNADRVRELHDHLKADGRDVTLKIFTNGETAATQGHADNPTLANERLGGRAPWHLRALAHQAMLARRLTASGVRNGFQASLFQPDPERDQGIG